jgi:predicted DCC family thiol-disulfide oxidoreductase YuxK
VLLFDGTCGFCARSVQFVLDHERGARTLRFATLQGPLGDVARRDRPELAGVDSMVWYEPSAGGARVLVRSDAAIAVLRHLGGPWRWLAAAGRLVPRVVRDAAYDLVARNRYRIAGRGNACLLPTPEQRRRIVDLG